MSQNKSRTAAVAKFDLAQWTIDLTAAATAFEGGAARLLALALAARGNVEHDTAREKFQDAFAAALATTHGVTDEEARASKSFKNRVSDAMAIFKAEVMPASLPNNLQRAADAVRKANPSGRTRKPRAGGKPEPVEQTESSVDVALDMLSNALEQLRHAVGDNATLLSLVGDLSDLANDIAEAVAAEESEVSEAA